MSVSQALSRLTKAQPPLGGCKCSSALDALELVLRGFTTSLHRKEWAAALKSQMLFVVGLKRALSCFNQPTFSTDFPRMSRARAVENWCLDSMAKGNRLNGERGREALGRPGPVQCGETTER